MGNKDVVLCRIHPGIGIARVGDSPMDYFIGPETPGLTPAFNMAFKDGNGRIRRQAARFRVFGLNAAGEVIQEMTASDNVTLQWTVTVANRKASGVRFSGVRHDMRPWDKPDDKSQLRNRSEKDRTKLDIVPTPRTISGADVSGKQFAFTDGSFYGTAVYLGELRTDTAGRLLVLGGHGVSASRAGARPLTQYADNDGWHDDTCDGPVGVRVTVEGRDIPVESPSWVLVAPPKFAPFVRNVVPLYDVMAEAAGIAAPAKLSFTDDIYPHFAAFADQQWVNAMSQRGHGPQKAANFRDPQVIERLNDNSAANAAYRAAAFARIREPSSTDPKQASYNYMPILSGDEGDCAVGAPSRWLSLPKTTYEIFKRWKDGDFDNDWPGAPPTPTALEALPIGDQPAALDKAALEPCVGGPFFPGIEITYYCRFADLYAKPFRFDAGKLKPGMVTQRMAVPWQADFFECQVHWWPAQRPDDVLNENSYRRALGQFPEDAREQRLAQATSERIRWDRGVGDRWVDPETNPPQGARPVAPGDNDMVEKWKTLGFVTPVRTDFGEILQIEVGRSQYDGLGDRDYFFYMLNIESIPTSCRKPGRLPKDSSIVRAACWPIRRPVRSTTCTGTFPIRRTRSSSGLTRSTRSTRPMRRTIRLRTKRPSRPAMTWSNEFGNSRR